MQIVLIGGDVLIYCRYLSYLNFKSKSTERCFEHDILRKM